MASIKVELIETIDGEKVYIDLNDVLDMFVKEKGKYIIVFKDGGTLEPRKDDPKYVKEDILDLLGGKRNV